MLKHSFVALTLTCVVAMPALAEPRLHFSDLASGPKAGNSDTSLGQTAGEDGTIVTVWGAGLGEAQGNSKITINGVRRRLGFTTGARPCRRIPRPISMPVITCRRLSSRSATMQRTARAASRSSWRAKRPMKFRSWCVRAGFILS